MRLLLLGPPGAGKGTLGRTLSRHFGVPHVAAGDIIRDHIARGTEFGRGVEAQIALGNFASDADILYWMSRRLEEPDAAGGYVLDGFPRTVSQAVAFDGVLDAVLWLNIDEAERQARLAGRLTCPQCGAIYHTASLPPKVRWVCDIDCMALMRRPEDDQDEQRQRIYSEVTAPLEQFYAARSLVLPIDASGSPEQVTDRAIQLLEDRRLAISRF